MVQKIGNIFYHFMYIERAVLSVLAMLLVLCISFVFQFRILLLYWSL